jgi:hypothetical protein
MKPTSIILLIGLLLAPAVTFAAPSWEQHGGLQVSGDGHRLQHADGTPFLWIGDTAWGMFQQLKREEVDQYLDNRLALGFTVIQSVAHWSPHGGGLPRSPDNAANAYGHRPFAGSEKLPDTGKPLVVDGGGPASPNDYWDNADYVIEAVRKRGMVLALLPCWGAQFNRGTKRYTEDQARIFGDFLGQRYKDVPNIIWVMGGDTKALLAEGSMTQAQLDALDFNSSQLKFDLRPIYRAMAEGIVHGVTGASPAWNQVHPAWDKVLMTYHPDGDAHANSSNWFHHDVWLDANGVEVWKEVQEVYGVMLKDYQLTNPVKPSLFLEGSYEYGTYRHECGWVTPVMVRRQFYHTFFAGGAGHTYGAGPIWAMRGNGGDYNCGYTWQQALDFPGAEQVAIIGQDFLRKHDWSSWVPDPRVIGDAGENESLKVAVTTKSGDMALVYFSNNSPTKVNNLLSQSAQASWFYPREGLVEKVEAFAPGESREMTPPTKWEDAILVLKTAGPVARVH